MSCSISFHIPKALPSLGLPQRRNPLSVTSKHSHSCTAKLNQETMASIIQKPVEYFHMKKSSLAVQIGAVLAIVEQPAFAVTGVNNEQDLTWTLIQLGVVAFFYFLVMPPIIMNWLRIRWYKRNLLETYFQFMFVFIFFAGVLLWAPFLNFRKFPRDPSMKYPWSKPEDPSKIKNAYLKYPFAEPEDYS
ncbi:NAD(P)H-quinone oxidoreductase subunit L [Morus notabilis]|uniref:NAD(P)H-quinone oxidoreductase subunit L n=1 Tax=Morus notabilis TaxID=981085 RepID=W9S5X4_9ROSA|nr:NAD(P)H-quinone oxidoreductase subunit L, chloroplastic isoform X2 [Morus notabilis]EXB90881.1 NAD(P)H-quinone oxidoreductase subunit L [Morus notabilis]